MGYGSEAVIVAGVVSALAAAASTGVSLYGASETQKAQQAAQTRTANANAENQMKADQEAANYRNEQERYRRNSYEKAQEERDRQSDFHDQAGAKFDKSAKEASISQQLMEEATQAARLRGEYGSAADTSTAIPGVDTGASAEGETGTRVVSGAYNDSLGKVSAFLGNIANARAGLDAKDNAGLADSIYQGRQLQDLNKISNFMKGSAAVLPSELQANNTARSILQQTSSDAMAKYGREESAIGQRGLAEIQDAQKYADTANGIAGMVGTVGNMAAGYAGNAAGSPPKAKPVNKPSKARVT